MASEDRIFLAPALRDYIATHPNNECLMQVMGVRYPIKFVGYRETFNTWTVYDDEGNEVWPGITATTPLLITVTERNDSPTDS